MFRWLIAIVCTGVTLGAGCGLSLDVDPPQSAADGGVPPTGCATGCGPCGECVDDVCVPVGADHVCRPASGSCDVEEHCDGTRLRCPADIQLPVGEPCGPGGLVCTGDGECVMCTEGAPCSLECATGRLTCALDGSARCEPTSFLAEVACRDAAGPCDIAETCDGTSPDCPPDQFVAEGTTECRSATDACDTSEKCDGSGPDCPDDMFTPMGAVCRPPAGPCDVVEVCEGDSPACPIDELVVDGTLCPGSTRDRCDGLRPECAPRAMVTDSCLASAGTCMDDADCFMDGCAMEVCTSVTAFTMCDCTPAMASCGCIGGYCAWFRVP